MAIHLNQVGLHKVNTMAGIWRWKTAQFAERKWWQLYLKKKDVTQYLNWKKDYWKGLLTKCNHYFVLQPDQQVLDAGCGPAGIFIALNNQHVTAYDPLIDEYELDLPHFKKSMYPEVRFVKAGLEDFATEQTYHVIFCMNAINHVHDIELSFDRMIQCAAPGAYIVMTIDAHTHTLFKKIFRLLPGDILHPHQYDLNEYQNMFTHRGCTIEGTELLKHEFLFDHYMLIARKKK